MNKANIEMTVVIVISAILIVIIIWMGYGYLKDVADVKNKGDITEFKDEFSNDISLMVPKAGSIITKKYVINSYNKLCLADIDNRAEILQNNITNGLNNTLLVLDSIASNTTDNAFLISETDVEMFNVGKITVKDNYKCFEIQQGHITLVLEGKGRKTLVRN